MKLLIIGTGCQKYQILKKNLDIALADLKWGTGYEEVTDVHKVLGYDVAELPALIIDDKHVIAGRVMTVEQIKDILTGYSDSDVEV